MQTNSFLKRAALCGSAVVTLSLATGCANLATTASPVSTAVASGAMSGHIQGGNQPVSNADIRLFSAGATGYGSAGLQYASTTTDPNGNFQFMKVAGAGTTATATYGCPTNGTDPQMYISAKGGNTQGAGNGSNPAAAFIIAIGKCSTISAATQVTMNELTTVATLAALQQYFSPANANTSNQPQFGMPASTQAQAGFANGVATISNLVNVQTGSIATATQTSSASGSALTVTVTPEATKLNTLANIGAACVNTTSSTSAACTTLFANATPPTAANTSQPTSTFGTATSTVGALWNMLANPTSGSATNINNLFNLQTAASPFQTSLTAAPTDWTVGIKYSSTSACATGNFLQNAYRLAADATGNIWIAGGSTNGNLMEISPNGTPLTCALGTTVASSKSVVLDVNGNVWIASGTTNNLYKYSPTTGTATTWPTLNAPFVVAADATGNVYYTSTAGSVAKFTGAALSPVATPSTQIATVGTLPNFIAIDTVGNVFVTNSAAGATTSLVYAIYPSTAAGNTAGYGLNSLATNACNPFGLSVGLANSIAISNSNYSACTNGVPNSNATDTFANNTLTPGIDSATFAGGLGAPRENAIDGAGNVWTANSTPASTNYVTGAASTSYVVSEFSASGTALSPTGNTGSASISGGFQKDSSIFPAGLRGVAIDPTGNVWVGLNSATIGTSAVSVSEIVGAAVPVVTPVASALLAGAATANAVSKP